MLRGPHVQSVLASSAIRRLKIIGSCQDFIQASRDEIVNCGDGVRLLAHHAEPLHTRPTKVVTLIHGWEGSGNSTYVISVAARLWQAGLRVVRLNLRDHGASVHLNRGLFHSCRLQEAVGAVWAIRQRFPGEELYLGGFSLGGNFCLRIAATAQAEELDVAGAVAICPVLDPAETMLALDGGWPVYRWYFMRKWRRSLERKKAAFPELYDFDELERFNSLAGMTEYFVRHYTEFPSLNDYLRGYAVTGDRLSSIDIPARILLAEDDPIIPIGGLKRVARSAMLSVDRSPIGGHCGFLKNYRLQSWLDDYLLMALNVNPGSRSRAA